MGALTMARFTPQLGDARQQNLAVANMASGARIFMGALVVGATVGTGSSMRAIPGRQGTGLRVLGVMDNQSQLIPGSVVVSETDGYPQIQLRQGTFKFDNDPNDPVTEQDLFKICYVASDHEVSKTSNGNARSFAGVVKKIDNSSDPTGPGVWVTLGELPTSGFPLPTGLGLP